MKFKVGDMVQITNKNHPFYGIKSSIEDTANSGSACRLAEGSWVNVDSLSLITEVEVTESPVTVGIEIDKILGKISLAESILDFHWIFKNQVIIDDGGSHLGWFIWVEFERPDIDTGELGTGKSRKEFVPKGTWTSGVVKTCWLLLELTIRHELMEAFTFRGARIFNPHNSVFDLAKINPSKE